MSVVAVLSASSVLTGCSSTDSASSASVCGSPGVDDHQINLGVISPVSGPASGMFDAVRAGVDARLGAANAVGGVHGRKIVYRWRDDQGAPQSNVAAARDLVEQQRAFGLIELSVAASGSTDYLTHQGIPVTGTAYGQDRTNVVTADTQGRFVHEQGGRRAVILQPALSPAVANSAASYARSLTAAGVRMLDTITYTAGVDDPAVIGHRIAASGADTVVGVLAPKDLITVVDAIRGGGYSLKVVLSATGYDHELLRTFGSRMAGISVPVFYRPFELGGRGVQAYVDAMRRYAPQITEPQQDTAVAAYISTDLFLRGLQLAGACPTRGGFVAALSTVNSYDADGLISPMSLRAAAGQVTTCYSFVQANPAGDGFVVVEPNLCGQNLA
ncbi:ABC transporter substrate-binding protein [Frankia sp. AiPa1]|uniref:ABC transporter substrate-binding protein n=1 Tax=Frankia sp. AiPa1 TaxID=573492 RepID=UPI00202B7FCB|nr:ABC transporter substrate-binding protein [Frankia sp. AiPa1]MCL9760478.1 ABC transporter substrate-binding protein [Frankia sp. AiPa1]